MADQKRDDGGPAFPRPASDSYAVKSQIGMTLRDYFAAKAMQAFIAEPGTAQLQIERVGKLVSDCYYIADAMLAERKK